MGFVCFCFCFGVLKAQNKAELNISNVTECMRSIFEVKKRFLSSPVCLPSGAHNVHGV